MASAWSPTASACCSTTNSTTSPPQSAPPTRSASWATRPTCPVPANRPLPSMPPPIVLKDGKPVLVTGSPGGSRIISTVLQVIVNVLDYRMDVEDAGAAPRVHEQWPPGEVRIERGFADDALAALRAMGHTIVVPLGQTSANSIAVTPNG